MAPEQFAGAPSASTDTYALGAVAYEMLSGQRAFSPDSLAHLVAEGKIQPARLRDLRPEVPEAAERAVQKALSFRPEDRQSRVCEFSEELCQALTVGPQTTRRMTSAGSLEIAHVLFMDLVSYSLMPMDQQKETLARLQQIVRQSPRFAEAEASGDIISLPTGDGMALAFFGDPTTAVQCALEVAAAVKKQPGLKLRMGVNSGPVYRIADVNANANVASGGINMAQRVMDCGDPGHILVSKSVAEVLLQLSQWAPCLSDLGEVAVKHGVKLHVYNLTTADVGNAAGRRKQERARRRVAGEQYWRARWPR